MNRHLGASYTLSVLIVVVFAVALYRADPDARPTRPGTVAAKEKAKIESGTVAARHEPVDRGKHPAEVVTSDRAGASLASRLEAIPGPAAQKPIPAPKSAVRQVTRRANRGRVVPKGAFTLVSSGETLDDVAHRVYGTPEASAELWKSNRDQLPTRETPPRAGMMLRTP